jgi:hypothetical protein
MNDPYDEMLNQLRAVENCRLCDNDGYRLPHGIRVCDHIDYRRIARRGRAAVKEAMGWK